MSDEPRKLVTVNASSAGQRIDNFLLRELKGVPRSRVYRIVRRGEVRVNRGRVKPGYRLARGDEVRIPPLRMSDRPHNVLAARSAAGLQLHILYEDDDILVIDKPAGLAVHAGSEVAFGVIEALRQQRPEAPFIELAHRLDRHTSGCLLLARNRSALQSLHTQFREGRPQAVLKRYLALVSGHWPAPVRRVAEPLKRRTNARQGHRMQVDDGGRAAASRFVPLEHFDGASLVEIHLETGRTHQARVHATHAGHPIAGDYRYGDAGFNRRMRGLGLARMFLHAEVLKVCHPRTGRRITVRAPLPEPLQEVLSRLRDAVAAAP